MAKRQGGVGLFWADAERTIKPPKAAKRPKPEPFWLGPTYLPGLSEALAMKGIERLTRADWAQLKSNSASRLSWDTECYPNYFSVGFKDLLTGKCDWIEMTPDQPLDVVKVKWVLENFSLVGFNSEKYDATMIALALGGCDNEVLKMASDAMIVGKKWPGDVLRTFKCHRVAFRESIDLKEIAPGIQSLKTYGARLHTKRTQDLPFDPSVFLSEEQKAIVRHYMCNDLGVTAELGEKLKGEIKLRASMSAQYGVNLLSKSDAQIAEQVIRHMYERHSGRAATVQRIEVGQAYQYDVPAYLSFQSKTMRDVLETVRNQYFVVGEKGSIDLPKELKNLKIKLGDSTYRMGIGGLHSTEKSVSHYAGDGYTLEDVDVASFYPRMILNQQLCPEHLVKDGFLYIYNEIVETRLACKESGDKIGADSLKIVINASFGKFGNKHSILYSPRLVIQVTISGQLSLLMLIDALESVGIKVVSANTDGIIIKAHESQMALRDRIIKWWTKTCQFDVEHTPYQSVHSRDVNSYYAVKYPDKDGKVKVKRKGAYSEASLSTTPKMNVCADAVEQLLATGRGIADSIKACKNVFDFVTVQNVTGGAVWKDQYLGKVCRFYMGPGDEPIIKAMNGNVVPSSTGSIPLMDTDGTMPDDINYTTYIEKAESILREIGLTV